MSAGCLLIHGGILIDDLTFADGQAMSGVLGGAALHAVAGAALWADDVLLIGGVGEDANESILPWMHSSGLSTGYLHVEGKFTPRNIFIYQHDGSRTETPAFGPDHFARLQPGPNELAARLPDARGAYVFHNADPSFWTPVLQAVQYWSGSLLWEISAESCAPGNRAAIAAIACKLAGFSLNLQEAVEIFGDKPRCELVEDVRALGAGVTFLRCGAGGSLVIWAQEAVAVQAYSASIVDVTGAGNAYGGGALAGLATGVSPVCAARMGAISASLAIGQHGLFLPRNVNVRTAARSLLDKPISRSIFNASVV